jgi:outer membrane receptor protein involved in Fe transport
MAFAVGLVTLLHKENTMMRKHSTCLLFVALALSGRSWGQDIPELPVVRVEEQSSALPVSSAPPSARTALPTSVAADQVFTREDIEAIRPRDVFDLMETSLGMSITRQGSRVNNFSSNRGGNVSFLLDGVFLTGTQVSRIVGDIPVGMIDSIQFVRDSSVLGIMPVMGFGSRVSSPGQGVVVINTVRKDEGKNSAQLKASYATFDTWKTSGAFRHSWLDGRLQLGGGYQHSQSAGKSHWNNGYDSNTYMLNGGWKDQDFMAMASIFVNKGEREIQRYIGVASGSSVAVGELGPELWEYDPRDTEAFSLNLARYWNERHTTSLTYGQSKADGTGWFHTTTAKAPPRYFKDKSSDLNLSHTWVSDKNTFKVGAQRVSFYQLTEITPGQAALPREEEIYGLYVFDEHFITPAWSIDGSARLDKKHVTHGGDKYTSDGGTVRVSDDTWTDKAYLFSVGSAWQINPVFRVSGRYAYSKTPAPDTITTAHDQSLPDERLNRWEFALNANLHPAFQASLTPFYYTIRDAKVTDATAAPINVYNPDTGQNEQLGVYTSVDKVTRKGFELALKGRFADDRLGYELGWSHFTDDSIDATTNNIETPKNRYTARLDGRYGQWNASLNVLRVDEYCHYFRGACLKTGDFTTVNLNVSRKFAHGVTVSLFGQNLTNEHYYTRHKTGTGGAVFAESMGAIADVGATYGIEVGVEF